MVRIHTMLMCHVLYSEKNLVDKIYEVFTKAEMNSMNIHGSFVKEYLYLLRYSSI